MPKLLKTDVFQITWHSGHRESHGWGGKRYSLSGSHGLPTREELFAQYGGGSLDDYGCRHDIIAVDPSTPPMFTDAELKELEAAEKVTKTFNGTQLNKYVDGGGIVRVWTKKYKAETKNGTVLNRDYQEQRKCEYERAIRSIRREQTIAKDIWENAVPEHKERLAFEYYALKNKNNLVTKEYERFCEKMGLYPEKNRIYYDGRGRLGGTIPKKYQALLQSSTKNVKINPYKGLTAIEKSKVINDRHIVRLEEWAKVKWGVQSIDLKGLDAKATNTTFKQMDKVISNFPTLKNYIFEIGTRENALMACLPKADMSGVKITFNKNHYNSISNIKTIYENDVLSFGSPKGTSFSSSGVHELGHAINAQMIRKSNSLISTYVSDWNNAETTKSIIDVALKRAKMTDDDIVYGIKAYAHQLNIDISRHDDTMLLSIYKGMKEADKRTIKICSFSNYALQRDDEALAEAFSDWYANGENANPLSKQIIKIVKGWF